VAKSPWDNVIDIGGSGPRLPPFSAPRLPSAAALRAIAIGVLALLLLTTSYYQIEPDQVGVVQRFGAFSGISDPGPHLKLPFGVDTVTKVPVQRQLKMEFGFRTASAGVRTEFAPENERTRGESAMLTGDLNVAVVEWIVQFRIKDPKLYLFHLRNPAETFRDMSEAAMRKVVGDHSVDEVLTIGREAIALEAKEELQSLCDKYQNGIEVQQLLLQDVNPPDPVKPAFNEVNQAIQEKERAINDAWADYNKSVPRAKGEAEQAIRSAEGYALERVNNAEGDAKRFDAIYEEYRKAPAVTKKRLYLEMMQELLPKLGKKLILDDKLKGVLPLLQLDGEIPGVKK
jgi:membrane protease subunit HflK